MTECDFCKIESEELTAINDDVWYICDNCMDLHYRILPRHLLLEELKKKGNCEHGVPYADCGGCEEE